MLRGPATLLVLALAVAPVGVRAADLDGPGYGAYVAAPYPPPPPPAYLGEARVIVTTPLSVGGPYLPIPGLNGPTGPSAYPLLPYAFGYGY